MNYPHQDPYQQDNAHGGQLHVPGHNRRTSSSTSRSLQPVQGGDHPQASRSLSASRLPAPGQAQPFDTYGAGQNREHPQAGLPFVQSPQSPQYLGPQGGQIHSASFPDQTYQSAGPYVQPSAHPPPQILSPNVRTPPAQYPQYQRDTSVRNPQQQWSSTPQYQQQQQPSSQRYPQQQQQQPSQPQTPYSAPSVNTATSYRPNVPGELREMPGEVTRQSRSMHRDTSPLCRFPNCHTPADRDEGTHELTEYCSLDHMRDDLRRGVPPCPACNKCPKRIDGKYCGTSCEKWVRQQQQQPQQRHQPYQPPSGVRPHSLPPSSGNVTWRTAATGNPQANIQHLSPGRPSVGGLVHCQNCGTAYTVPRGRSRPRYETEQGDSVGHMSLPPPCPQCGYSRRT